MLQKIAAATGLQKKPPGQTPDKTAAEAPGFDVREVKMLGELGMSRDELRARRQAFLEEGTDWALVSNRVMLSRSGAEKLRATKGKPIPVPEKTPAAAGNAERPTLLLTNGEGKFEGRLIAWAMPLRNVKLLVCYVPGTDPNNPLNLVSCFVRSNENFLRGMNLTARQRDERMFELVGQCPRKKGRW